MPLPEDAPRVVIETNHGDIVVGLYEELAPISVRNFLDYVDADYYDGTVFHRVRAGFMIQGGGFVRDGEGVLRGKSTRAPIVNEAANELRNLRGTMALARRADPDSATSQFFINLVDNQALDKFGDLEAGYTVFGLVLEGMEAVDAIAAVPTHLEPPFPEPAVPDEDVVIRSIRLLR